MSDATPFRELTLPDGRRLGYSEYGDLAGKPLFYFHGFPGSRLDWQLSDGTNRAAALGVRVISADRPGYGRSDDQPGRRLVDWPKDVVCLADHLGLERFSVLGLSGGAPFAAACAHELADRLTAVGIVSGMGPADAPGMRDGVSWTVPGKPWPLRWLVINLMSLGVKKSPERVLASTLDMLPVPDRAFLEQDRRGELFLAVLAEAFRSGTAGARCEAGLYRKPWGFGLEDIEIPVHLWHGELDLNVPPSVGRHVGARLSDCRAHESAGEGHFTACANHLEEILDTLCSSNAGATQQ